METDAIYTVYALTDGLVEDIYDAFDWAEAVDAFHWAVAKEREAREQHTARGEAYAETSIHLYEPGNGIMHTETTIAGGRTMRRIQTGVLKAAPNGKGIRGDGFNYWQFGGHAIYVHYTAMSAVRKG